MVLHEGAAYLAATACQEMLTDPYLDRQIWIEVRFGFQMREPEPIGPRAHIIVHDEGAGAPTRDTVVQRARELATIAGRTPDTFTDEDLRQARRELLDTSEQNQEASLEPELPFEPGNGEVLGGSGSEARNFASEDESTVAEDLVQEGLDEALHDEMLEAQEQDKVAEE